MTPEQKLDALILTWENLTGQSLLEIFPKEELGPYAEIRVHFIMLMDKWEPRADLYLNGEFIGSALLLGSQMGSLQSKHSQ
jgi:hypothetical protein